MAKSGIRCTFFIQDDLFGISETYIHPATEIDAALNDARALMKKRLKLCGVPAVAVGVRLSKEGVFRDSRVIPGSDFVDDNPQEETYGAPNSLGGPNQSDQPKSCLLLRAESGTLRRASKFLAGIPDFAIREDPRGPIVFQVPGYATAFNSWRNLLISKAWGFLAKSEPVGNLAPRTVKEFQTQALTGLLQIITQSGAAIYQAGDTIQLRNFKMTNKGYKTANGTFSVKNAEANTPAAGQQTYTLYGTEGIAVSTIKFPGTIQLIDYDRFAIDNVVVIGQTTRKRGNRFLVGVGRKKVPHPISL